MICLCRHLVTLSQGELLQTGANPGHAARVPDISGDGERFLVLGIGSRVVALACGELTEEGKHRANAVRLTQVAPENQCFSEPCMRRCLVSLRECDDGQV